MYLSWRRVYSPEDQKKYTANGRLDLKEQSKIEFMYTISKSLTFVPILEERKQQDVRHTSTFVVLSGEQWLGIKQKLIQIHQDSKSIQVKTWLKQIVDEIELQ